MSSTAPPLSLLPGSTSCLLLMMPTEMLGLPLLLIALLHLTILGLRFACQMSSSAGSIPPPPPPTPPTPIPLPLSLHRKLPSHLPTATLYANYFCQCAPDEHCVSFRMHAGQRQRRGQRDREGEVVVTRLKHPSYPSSHTCVDG